MIRYHGGLGYEGSDDHANDVMRADQREREVEIKRLKEKNPNMGKKTATVIGPESFITDAAKPLLAVVDQLIGYPQAKKDVQRAREYIEKAMSFLDKAYSDVR